MKHLRLSIADNNRPEIRTNFHLQMRPLGNGYLVNGFEDGRPVEKSFSDGEYGSDVAAHEAAMEYLETSADALESHLDGIEDRIKAQYDGIEQRLKDRFANEKRRLFKNDFNDK